MKRRKNISVYIRMGLGEGGNGFRCLTSVSQETQGSAGAESPAAAEGFRALYLLVEFLSRRQAVCSDLTMFGHGGSTQPGLKTASLETNWETKLPAKA